MEIERKNRGGKTSLTKAIKKVETDYLQKDKLASLLWEGQSLSELARLAKVLICDGKIY